MNTLILLLATAGVYTAQLDQLYNDDLVVTNVDMASKQDKLIAGENITISSDNVISATGGGGGGGGINTNGVRSLIDASFVGGTNAVNTAVGEYLPRITDSDGNKTAITIGSRNGTVGKASLANGNSVEASSAYSHAEGFFTKAQGQMSHAEGVMSKATQNYAHAEGNGTTASGYGAHAEGLATTANGNYSHASGYGSTAQNQTTFVWQGMSTDEAVIDESTIANLTNESGRAANNYTDHGAGTFNINPAGGVEGFYIGGDTLKEVIESFVPSNSFYALNVIRGKAYDITPLVGQSIGYFFTNELDYIESHTLPGVLNVEPTNISVSLIFKSKKYEFEFPKDDSGNRPTQYEKWCYDTGDYVTGWDGVRQVRLMFGFSYIYHPYDMRYYGFFQAYGYYDGMYDEYLQYQYEGRTLYPSMYWTDKCTNEIVEEAQTNRIDFISRVAYTLEEASTNMLLALPVVEKISANAAMLKQDKLTAGENITIIDNVISATYSGDNINTNVVRSLIDTSFIGGTNSVNTHIANNDAHVTSSQKTEWSNKQNALTAGNNITISGSTISATDTTDYTLLSNKPQIGGISLSGNKTLNELGIQPKGNYLTSEADPIWISDKPSYATKSYVTEANSNTLEIVNSWENFLDGSNVVFSITNYISGVYALDEAKLKILELKTNEYHEVYNSRDEILLHLNDFETNKLIAATNALVTGPIAAVNTKVDAKADKAWGQYTSAGGVAPSNTVYMTAPSTVFAGGLEYERVAVGEGMVGILTTKGAPVYTAGDEGTFKFQDDGGTNYFGFSKTDSYTLGCNTDGISVNNHLVTLTYNVTMSGVPCIWYCSTLDVQPLVWEQLNTPDGQPIAGASHTVSWEGTPPAGQEICYINCPEAKGFFKATVEVAGSAKFMTNMPADLSGGIMCTNTANNTIGIIRPSYNGSTVTWTWSTL